MQCPDMTKVQGLRLALIRLFLWSLSVAPSNASSEELSPNGPVADTKFLQFPLMAALTGRAG